MSTELTEAEYLRIALAMQNISATEEICDRIIATYNKVKELRGDFSLKDAIDIKVGMDYKYTQKELQNKEGGK